MELVAGIMGGLTAVIKVLPKLHVPMPASGDVEIALHLIAMHTPINPTAVRLHPSRNSRSLLELLAPSRRTQIIMDILLLIILSPATVPILLPPLLLLLAQSMLVFTRIVPLRPQRRIFL
jgi:hypothetical protein